MYIIDKKKFGAFVAALRREKGCTQRELARQLCISDKAVSKWETGASIPDTALLIPLSELLGVSVKELLMGRRMPESDPMDAAQVERIVQTAIQYGDADPAAARQRRRRWAAGYFAALLPSCAGVYLCYRLHCAGNCLITFWLLAAIFGLYFCLFAKERLPAYYDENCIHSFSDGPVRMNLPGVCFNNHNWPHILQALRIWSVVAMAAAPALYLLLGALLPESWVYAELVYSRRFWEGCLCRSTSRAGGGCET